MRGQLREESAVGLPFDAHVHARSVTVVLLCSGLTPEPAIQDETAHESDDSASDGVQGDHAGQQECEHHQGCAALPGAVSARDHDPDDADQKRDGEEHAAGLGEPKAVSEPPPVASEPDHG
jgi:hypothetical protein